MGANHDFINLLQNAVRTPLWCKYSAHAASSGGLSTK